MKHNKKLKKGKLALLALAGSALVASLIYDKKNKIEKISEIDLPNNENEEVENEIK